MQEHGEIAVRQDGGILPVIERMASNPSLNADNMERMVKLHILLVEKQYEFQDRQRKEEARVSYCEAFAEMQGNLPSVVKGKENKFAAYHYADYDDIRKAINPYLLRHGFFLTHRSDGLDDAGNLKVTTRLSHRSGHYEEVTVPIPPDSSGKDGKSNKTPIHAIGSSNTYGYKYGTLMILGLSTAKDTDGAKAPVEQKLTVMQRDTLLMLIMEATEEKREEFMAKFGSADNVPVTSFDLVCAKLRAKPKPQGADNGAANV